MQFKVGAATDVGRKRAQNQDSMSSNPELGLFVVADGMGGHRGGEIASAIAVKSIPEVVRESQSQGIWDARITIAHAVRAANRNIFQHALQHPELRGMGTTTTALLFKDGRVTVGHVGDSRCYFFRPDAVWQATRDHSLVAEKVRAGLLTREQAKTDRLKNVITRSVGFEPEVNVEIYEMATQPGDIFLICSDGLSGLVEDTDMLELVQRDLIQGRDPQRAVKDLIEAANSHGGDDNITAVVIEVTGV